MHRCSTLAGLPFGSWFLALLCTSALQAEPLDERIDQLVRQLNADSVSTRDDAEQSLVELAPVGDADASDAFLERLPQPLDGMPEEVRLRLGRIRQRIENRQAKEVLTTSRLTLKGDGVDLAVLFQQIDQQTGNRLSDHREKFGQEAEPRTISLDIKDEAFWPMLDKILDHAKLGLYPFSGEETLAYINQEAGAAPRVGRASYSGPFRIEAIKVVAQRSVRTPAQQGLQIKLEIAWEPRLKPIALSQPSDKILVTTSDGAEVPLANPQAVLGVEVQSGSHATELNIPLELPSRRVDKLAFFRGELSALVPARVVEFRFTGLEGQGRAEQQRSGVKVSLRSVRKNQAIWEVDMRLQVASEEAGLESHRGWVFQNIAYLENNQGEVIDHAGFETTMQTEREIGLTYLFELPDDQIGDYTWVYRTPAAIVRVPVKYELKDIPLP